LVPSAKPQDRDPCTQTVPFSSGRVRVLLVVSVVGSRVVANAELLSDITNSPVLATLNLVTPDALAAIISPLFNWLTINALFPPIPPEIDKGAGVVALPTNTLESASLDSIRLPVPFGRRVRLSLDSVPIVAGEPPPRLSVVALIPRVAAEVMVVSPVAESVVSLAANVKVLLPESSVRVFAPVDVIVPAPTKSRELISSTVPSILMLPRSALSLIVILPVLASTSNSLKLIAVAPPLIEVREVPLTTVVPIRLNVSVLAESTEPTAPPRGERTMFPVVLPPIVNVLFLKD
jgi:hypothetical protein